MIFLQVNENKKVEFIHYKPFDRKYGLGETKEQLEQEGILVDSIPEVKKIEGKTPIMYYTKEKGIYYEYEDIPKSKEELQQESINNLVQTVAKLNLQNKKKDTIAITMAQTIASLNLRINKLEKEGR